MCALNLLELMTQCRPFSYISKEHFRAMITKAFAPNSVKVANALIQVQRTGKLTDQLADKYTDGVLLSRLLPVLAHLGFSLKAFQETMLPFAEKLHEAEQRLDITYAEIFDAYFPKEPTFEDAGGWMSMTNVTQTLQARSCATKPPVSLDSSCQGSAAAFGNHCQGNAVPFGFPSQQGALAPIGDVRAKGIAIPLESQPRFEMSTHKQKNGLWVFISKHKNPQGIIR